MPDAPLHAQLPPEFLATALSELIGRIDAPAAREDGARRLIALATELLGRGAPCPVPPAAPQGSLAAWQVRRLRAHVEAHLEAGLPVPELAGLVRLSPSYFHRAFKASFGETPHDYILRRRIARAQQRMLETREPLARIALDCGLSDQAHLCRVFRRFTGESPNGWRRRSRAS